MQQTLSLLKDQKLQLLILKWAGIWLIIAGGTIYVLPPFGADQLNLFYITSVYFFSFAVVGGYYFKVFEVFPHHIAFRKQLFPILLIGFAFILFCLAYNLVFPLSTETYSKIMATKFYFPLFKIETLVTKFCDIAFQQVFIFGLVKMLKKQQLTDRQTLIIFSISFFLIHTPLIFSLKWYALLFILPSSFAGVIFSYLILKFPRGLTKSFTLHFSFYLVVGLFLRH